MRKTLLATSAAVCLLAAPPLTAQKTLSVDAGLFGQFTKLDSQLSMDDVFSGGGRLSIYLLRNLAAEGDIQLGSTKWTYAGGTKNITYRPYAFRLVYGIPLGAKAQFLIGAGYQNNVYSGRTQPIAGITAPNEYEDAVTGLAGLKFCLNEGWTLRLVVPVDYNPSPNFNGSTVTLNGTSTNIGFRVGLGYMLHGKCYEKSAPPPPPPAMAPTPAPTPTPTPEPTPAPAPPPNQAPVATITSPSNGSSFTGPTSFAGSCRDPEQGDITSGARWRSSRDGDIGTGGSFSHQLTTGAHTITLTCSDNQGLTGTATVSVTRQELLVRLNWVYFNFDRSTLTKAGRDTLDHIIETLKNRPDMNLAVEGHTDPYGSDDYNQRLSERRAQTVVDYLTRGGVPSGRMASKGFGEQCLVLDDNHDHPAKSRADHRVNRRVEIWSVGDAGVSASCRPNQ